MEDYHVKPGKFIPYIYFDASNNILEISGNSWHEYTDEFFTPAFEWIDSFLMTEGRQIILNFRMDYFNTATSKCFFLLLLRLQQYQDENKGKVTVNWYYNENDSDMQETGEELKIELESLQINLIPYSAPRNYRRR